MRQVVRVRHLPGLSCCLWSSGRNRRLEPEPHEQRGKFRRGERSSGARPSDPLAQWEGLPVRRISFDGVSPERLVPLPGHLAQAEGAPLNREDLKKSLRQLFSTGLFETIAVEGERDGDGVALIFRGTPRTFIGTVSVDGAKGATINTQLERASQLAPGTRFTPAKLDQALEADARDAGSERLPRAGDYPDADGPPGGATGRHCVSCGSAARRRAWARWR